MGFSAESVAKFKEISNPDVLQPKGDTSGWLPDITPALIFGRDGFPLFFNGKSFEGPDSGVVSNEPYLSFER